MEEKLLEKALPKVGRIIKQNLPKYKLGIELNEIISDAYCGQGFMCYNNEGYRNRLYDQYDINSAYPAALCLEYYPLNDKFTRINLVDYSLEEADEIVRNNLGIVTFYVKSFISKFDSFTYNLFEYNIAPIEFEGEGQYWQFKLCSIDYENFLKLYDVEDLYLEEFIRFDSVGHLGIKLVGRIKMIYDDIHELKYQMKKEEAKALKTALNICSYGKLAEKDFKLYNRTGKMCRSDYVIVAVFECAYVRKKMIDLFLKYKYFVKMIDTDCIVLDSKVKFDNTIGDSLGMFKEEFKNKKFALIRQKGYLVIDDNKVIKQKISGLENEIPIDQLNNLFKYGTIKVQEFREVQDNEGYINKKLMDFEVKLEWPKGFSNLNLK